MLKLQLIRELTTHLPTQKGRPSFVTAASGLVLHDGQFYIVADDELSLAVFPLMRQEMRQELGHFIPLFPGELPLAHEDRKKAKPDLEALCLLDSRTLLALPSGSKKNRSLGALISMPNLQVKSTNLSELFVVLSKSLPEINLEGAVVLDQFLFLFQRGNGQKGQNALIKIKLEHFLENHFKHFEIIPVSLGVIEGVQLSFTDAALGPDGVMYFIAVAEASNSTYLDGEFKGAILGALSPQGQILMNKKLKIGEKPEGLCFDQERFFIVTDADDSTKPARLYEGNFLDLGLR